MLLMIPVFLSSNSHLPEALLKLNARHEDRTKHLKPQDVNDASTDEPMGLADNLAFLTKWKVSSFPQVGRITIKTMIMYPGIVISICDSPH